MYLMCDVTGVNTTEVMLGHICTQFFVMFVQVSLLLIFALGVFGVSMRFTVCMWFPSKMIYDTN